MSTFLAGTYRSRFSGKEYRVIPDRSGLGFTLYPVAGGESSWCGCYAFYGHYDFIPDTDA